MAAWPFLSALACPSQAQCGHTDPPLPRLISAKGEEPAPSPPPTLSSSFFARKKSSTKPLSPEISSEVTCKRGSREAPSEARPVDQGVPPASASNLPRGGEVRGGTHGDGGLAGGFPVLEKERLAHPLLSHDLQGGGERWADRPFLGRRGWTHRGEPFPAVATPSLAPYPADKGAP